VNPLPLSRNAILAQLVQDGAAGEILIGPASSDLAEEVKSAELC